MNLLGCLYYFNVLYAKIELLMLGVYKIFFVLLKAKFFNIIDVNAFRRREIATLVNQMADFEKTYQCCLVST